LTTSSTETENDSTHSIGYHYYQYIISLDMVILAIFYYGYNGASLCFKSVGFGFVTQSQLVQFSQVKNTKLC